VEASLPSAETFLFGVRPCDARALLLVDKVFLDGDQNDPYYARLREKTTVIGLACAKTTPSCFCTSVGSGPGDGTGADVLAEATPAALQEAEERIHAAEDQLAPVATADSVRRLREAYEPAKNVLVAGRAAFCVPPAIASILPMSSAGAWAGVSGPGIVALIRSSRSTAPATIPDPRSRSAGGNG
jgi:hypothetical protein